MAENSNCRGGQSYISFVEGKLRLKTSAACGYIHSRDKLGETVTTDTQDEVYVLVMMRTCNHHPILVQ